MIRENDLGFSFFCMRILAGCWLPKDAFIKVVGRKFLTFSGESSGIRKIISKNVQSGIFTCLLEETLEDAIKETSERFFPKLLPKGTVEGLKGIWVEEEVEKPTLPILWKAQNIVIDPEKICFVWSYNKNDMWIIDRQKNVGEIFDDFRNFLLQ